MLTKMRLCLRKPLIRGLLPGLVLMFVLGCVRHQVQALPTSKPQQIGFHKAIYDADGKLLPWTTWEDAIAREMAWYANCPSGPSGYPVFVYSTFMDGEYRPTNTEVIPAMQNGMGILSYLKYWEYNHRSNPKILELARKMGDYLALESLTRNDGPYPRFTRSTGHHTDFPVKVSSQGDEKFGPDVIEPDKGGLAGYALLKLFQATGDRRYFDQALHNAECLARNMRDGDASQSPWPFRVDAVRGTSWGRRSGNMAFNLRLFDELIALGHPEFKAPRDALWTWIKTYQIPSPEDRSTSLWIQFFEDQTAEDNRTSWAPLELARYLIEKKEALDLDWKVDAERPRERSASSLMVGARATWRLCSMPPLCPTPRPATLRQSISAESFLEVCQSWQIYRLSGRWLAITRPQSCSTNGIRVNFQIRLPSSSLRVGSWIRVSHILVGLLPSTRPMRASRE